MAVVAALRVAPVKGLAAVHRDSVRLEHRGVAEDRRLFLLDDRGHVVTLRSHPQLVQAVPDLDLQGGVLRVTVPDTGVAETPLGAAAQSAQAQLYGKDRAGRVLPGDVADALSALAGERVHVVLAGGTGVGWDEGPVSLLGRASAAVLGGPGADMRRYRMLVEVDGTAPFEEDGWIGRDLAVGDARMHVTHELVRCVIITQSPDTGAADWDGLTELARLRGRDHICLGVVAEVVTPGEVHVGARVALVA